MGIDEKMTMLIKHYDGCYDLSIAKLKVEGLTDEEFEQIQDDTFFQTSINIIDASLQERIMNNLIDLSSSQNEAIKLKATLELGKVQYKKKFDKKNDSSEDEHKRMPTIILDGVYPDGNE